MDCVKCAGVIGEDLTACQCDPTVCFKCCDCGECDGCDCSEVPRPELGEGE